MGVFFGAGLLLLGGGWAMFHWLASLIEDPTTSEGQEAEEPAEQEGPPSSGFDD
ncbi:hypothetical protein DB31_9024 [Hyalangium minutum]|uniref:Uncharacterized protein n=1 Tax=Hyalangium minutum TaxID=394096 RepID=A0A085WGJ7_9BACT|nr:hypothetical protein DB31_9024 [Hyalangium minutum]